MPAKRLTKAKILSLKAQIANGLPVSKIAKEFKVSPTTVLHHKKMLGKQVDTVRDSYVNPNQAPRKIANDYFKGKEEETRNLKDRVQDLTLRIAKVNMENIELKNLIVESLIEKRREKLDKERCNDYK